MSVASALSTLRAARDSIRAAIVGKGGSLPEGSPMSDYPAAISNLPTGGGGGGPVELTYTGNYVQSVLTDEVIANWNLDTSAATNFGYMFRDCSSLTSVPQLDTSAAKDFRYMFSGCSSLSSVPMLDTSAATNFIYMFSGCTALTTVPQLDTAAGTNFTRMFYGCSSLTQIGIHGFRYSIDISDCKLDADNLNAFFTQAGTAYNTSQKLTITGNPGAADCDKTIATDKGWTVTG